MTHRHLLLFCLALAPSITASSLVEADERTFRLSFSGDIRAEPYTGRVVLLFSRTRSEPRTGPGWFKPELFVARDVSGWKPGTTITFSGRPSKDDRDDDRLGPVLAYPVPLSEMKLEGYRAQAVVRFNPHERIVGTGPGNGFSATVTLGAGSADEVVELTVDQAVKPRPFTDTRWSKLLAPRSKLLTAFHDRPVDLRAAVILPASYHDQPRRRYPVIFTIPGFGGTHHQGRVNRPVPEENDGGVEFLRVLLDPSCPLGHHVFADSANNGPVGRALVTELIPALDRRFRTISQPTARFLTGHSSGGWSSLWLQVTYPETFAGTWSTAPDPVDFRDFQRINLYRQSENMYVDADGNRRPLARIDGQVRLWYRGFAEMEWVLGYGGQLHSFEAVFSPRGPDGRPRLIWDRRTGRVDPRIARTWEQYDIRLILEKNWKTLGPRLAGKLHVHMGDQDTFYLEGATMLLKQSLAKLGSDAVVEIHEGRNHFNLLSGGLNGRIRREMTTKFLEHHPEERRPKGH